MHDLPVLDQLPSAFALQRGPRGFLAVRRDLAVELARFGFGLAGDGPLIEAELGGRRPLAALEVGQERLLVRHFTHGGLARWITGRRFADPQRPFAELLLSESLRGRGIPTPEVVAARARRAPGVGWHLDLVTRRVPGARDLGALLAGARRGEVPAGHLRSVLLAAGALVRSLHEAGLEHVDLNPNNLLLGAAPEPRAAGSGPPPLGLYVLDLDRSRLHRQLGSELRRRSLARLFRHVARRERRHGAVLTRSDYLRFLRGYAGREWKPEWRAIRARERRWAWLHGLGGLFERSLGRARDPREQGPATGDGRS